MKKQKLILVSLAALICCLVLAGCGNKKTAETKEELAKYLVGYWKMDDNESNSMKIVDSSGNNGGTAKRNTAVLHAVGKVGGSLNFNGVSDFIVCGNAASLNPTDSVTLSAWIYPVTASKGSIITKNGPYCMQFGADGKIIAGVYAGLPNVPTSWTYAKGTSVLPLNAWHHVLATYDGSYIKIYIDGEIDGTPIAKSGDMAVTPSPVYVGYGAIGFDNYFCGLIDEIRIFNKALSADEASSLYNK